MSYKHALRSLKRTPVFAFAAMLTLALGIAAVGAMFAIVHGVLLAPLPYGRPERLVDVGLQSPTLPRMQQPPAVYLLYEKSARHLDGIGFYRTGNANIWVEGGDAAAERVTATWVTASTMPLLHVPPLLGRAFTEDEQRLGGPGAVMLGESEWRRRFGAAPDILGKTLMVNSVPRRIVGVMPAHFAFPTADTRLWLPARLPADAVVGDFAYAGVARLAAGATVEQAQRELAALLPSLAQTFPRLDSGGSTAAWLAQTKPAPTVRPLRDEITGDVARLLWMLAAAAALVLLVAWANVANLMLIRADDRQLELAVRETLGAGRWRVAGHFFGESLLLGAAAAALALFATHAALRALVAFGPAGLPRLQELQVGPATVGFIAAVALLSVAICAAVPAFRLRRTLSLNLRDGTRSESAGKGRQRLRAAIAALQIALALVVSAGSALLLRTAQRVYDVHPGFEAGRVTTIWTQLPFARYDDAAAVAFYARLTEAVRQLPSVREAGVAMHLPLANGETLQQTFRIEGETRSSSLPVNVVDGGYFAAMDIPLLAGRGFGPLEHERGTDLVVSRRAAAALFDAPDAASAVGKRVALAPTGPTYTIVGVVGDVRDRDLATAPSATIYRPQVVPLDPAVEPAARRTMALVVASDGPAAPIVSAVRRIVRELDPAVPIFNVESMHDLVRASTARLSLALALMSVAAAISLLLGAIGLYGVMAYLVALRTREFGVRIALGAEPRRIARWVAARGLALAALGIAAGLLLHALAAPFLRAFLYGVAPGDPATLAAVTLVLAGIASLASWLPARRAARVAPADALRAE